jgi:hypothetical protein
MYIVIEDAANPANPMEPRDPSLAFSIGGRLIPASPPGAAELGESGELGAAQARWRAKRREHYNEMAAALRYARPPSSDEDSEETGGEHVSGE